jgi:hypothetical protein
MAMKDRKWLSVTPDSTDGEHSRKQVVSSDLRTILRMDVDEAGTGCTRVHFELPGLWHDSFDHSGSSYDLLETDEGGYMQVEGSPRIPQEGLFIAIPENAIITAVKVVGKTEVPLDGQFLILPAPKPVFEGQPVEHKPDPAVYGKDQAFPGKDIEDLGVKRVAGHKVAHVMVFLSQYRPLSRSVVALKSIDIEVHYETKAGMDSEVARHGKMGSPVEKLILDLDTTVHGPPKGMQAMDASLKDPATAADFVIITTDDLKSSFATFAAIKTFKHKVKIVTLAEIKAEFPAPSDDVCIRNFLVFATESWVLPPRTVILGGNIDKIPTHMQSHQGENIPSDHFFADLRGDICPDLTLSRFPASNPADMQKLCETAAYYNRHGGDWRKKVMLTTFDRADYNQCKDEIATTIGTNLAVTKRYDGQATKQQVIDTINLGLAFVNYRGHGSQTEWQASNGLKKTDIPGLNNGDMTPQVLSIACLNNSLDFAGGYFGQSWMVNQKAVSFLSASRPSYTDVNHKFDKYLWDGIINQGFGQIGDIFTWGTTKLWQNNPDESSKHNIYMYLLLGDPTADYKEVVMPTETKVGFVMMLDSSGTMHDATPMVKIDAKAFVRQAMAGDQFGINQFNNNATWIYPGGATPQIATVGEDLLATKDAAQAIENLVQANPMSCMTDLGDAVALGNAMIGQATTDVKAFVILSDGMWNKGPNPSTILGNNPPIFVAGLGPYLQKEMFDPLLAKNPKSKFYWQPNAYQMMLVFDEIRSLPTDVGLMSNALSSYQGADYVIIPSVVSADSEVAQFAVVWSDSRFHYTSDTPNGYNVNVALIDPSGKTLATQPSIAEPGYCIFNLPSVQPGTWRTLVQYSVPQPAWGTHAGFQFNTVANLEVVAPNVCKVGNPLRFTARLLDEGKPVEGLTIHAHVTRPSISLGGAISKYKRELEKIQPNPKLLEKGATEAIAKLAALRVAHLAKGDILAPVLQHAVMRPKANGVYEGCITETKEAGPYGIEITVTGTNPATKRSFSRNKRFAVLVG